MKKIYIFLMIAGVIILASCGGSPVDKAMNQIDDAIAKVEKKKANMTEADWLAVQKEVEEPLKVIADALEKDKVGALKKIKILATTARWATVLAEAGMNEMEKKAAEFGKELENANRELEKMQQQTEEKVKEEAEAKAEEEE
jgi:hypothetical protein